MDALLSAVEAQALAASERRTRALRDRCAQLWARVDERLERMDYDAGDLLDDRLRTRRVATDERCLAPLVGCMAEQRRWQLTLRARHDRLCSQLRVRQEELGDQLRWRIFGERVATASAGAGARRAVRAVDLCWPREV